MIVFDTAVLFIPLKTIDVEQLNLHRRKIIQVKNIMVIVSSRTHRAMWNGISACNLSFPLKLRYTPSCLTSARELVGAAL